MIDKATLRAFGFKKNRKKLFGNFSNGSYYCDALETAYDPKIHSNKQFALNLTSAIVHKAKAKMHLLVDANEILNR